jgi:glycosyltransferase involved in cell wall biosynthesis
MNPDASRQRVVIVTDAWTPQTNGVVRTLTTTRNMLVSQGHDVHVIEPNQFHNFACPTYPEIRLSWLPSRNIAAQMRALQPNAVHIATEGPLGMAARSWCLKQSWPYTTSYHTQFPEYVRARFPVPLEWSYAWLRRFHGRAARTMVSTPSMQSLLESRGFKNIARWSRGVDVQLFRPRESILSLPRPISAYVGRVAVEKNIEDFLKLKLPGTKVVIGDGPEREALQAKYPDVVFVGYKFGEELAQHVASCDVMVFPSRTDTFGLVLIEAMACGVPVAAYPVTGPIDVVKQGITGVLDEDLQSAAINALKMDRNACREHALNYTWEIATQQFFCNLAPIALAQHANAAMTSSNSSIELALNQ